MAAIKKEMIIIDVTRGDCLEANRKSGKSNTGTYFVSSLKDFDKYKSFFENDDNFFLNISMIKVYMILFKDLFIDKMEEYNGKGEQFDSFCNYLLSLKSNPQIEITLRINDSRVFMRFKNNSDVVVNAFRNLLYEDISHICIAKNKNTFDVYPLINVDEINDKDDIENDDFIFDD